jgi:hypothetical protein
VNFERKYCFNQVAGLNSGPTTQRVFTPLTKSATSEFTPLAKERRCRTRTLKFTKAQRIFNREHMNRPLGEYQKNMIDGVLKKYGKYTVKRPIGNGFHDRQRQLLW